MLIKEKWSFLSSMINLFKLVFNFVLYKLTKKVNNLLTRVQYITVHIVHFLMYFREYYTEVLKKTEKVLFLLSLHFGHFYNFV